MSCNGKWHVIWIHIKIEKWRKSFNWVLLMCCVTYVLHILSYLSIWLSMQATLVNIFVLYFNSTLINFMYSTFPLELKQCFVTKIKYPKSFVYLNCNRAILMLIVVMNIIIRFSRACKLITLTNFGITTTLNILLKFIVKNVNWYYFF